MACFLIFTEAREGRWWSRFLRPGFRHVSILTLNDGIWTLIRPLYGWTEVTSLPWQAGDIPSHLFNEPVVAIPFHVEHIERLRGLVGLHSCVGQAKAYMGIRAPWVLTPYQLYKFATTRYAGNIYSAGNIHSGSEDQPNAPAEGRAA